MQLYRGALPSPRHIAYATAPSPLVAFPPVFGLIPPVLRVWGNDQYGDCVSAEEAGAKAIYSLQCGLPETTMSDATVIAWARKHGFLNGATLTDVMDVMQTDGMQAEDGKIYTDGPYKSVDWTNSEILNSAIFQGPVKIGVDAGQLQTSGKNGWFGLNYRREQNIDHAVNLCGYGTLKQLADIAKVSLPSGADPGEPGYFLFTWGTIGILNAKSMIAITGEAWLRTPTTVGQTPPPTPPTPPTPPGPPIYSGQYQVGPILVTWTGVINDPVPPVGGDYSNPETDTFILEEFPDRERLP